MLKTSKDILKGSPMICFLGNRHSNTRFKIVGHVSLSLFLLAFLLVKPCWAEAEDKIYTDKDGEKTYIDPDYQPPTLDELNAKVKWKKGEMRSGLKEYEKFLATQKRDMSFADALKLKNTSTETNQKITDAMRWLPTKDDKPAEDATANRRIKGDVTSTNPIMITTIEDFDLYNYIAAGIIIIDADMKPYASEDIVTSWERSEDGLYDKFVLRDDLIWSDGKPMTAYDLEFAFQLIMRADILVPAVRSSLDELKYVKAYDAQTVVFIHKRPLITNIWNMDMPFMPKHIYEKTWRADKTLATTKEHRELLQNPIVGGAYKIVKRELGQEILLERREEYYMHKGKQVRPKPNFKYIRLRIITDPNTALLALKRGDIDEMELLPQQWQNQTGDDDFYKLNTKARAPEWTYSYFGWNLRNPIFADPKVRQAMALAFPHEELIKVQNYDLVQAGRGMYHPDSWMFPKDENLKPYKQDIDKALDLLEQAGWEDTDNDGVLDKVLGKTVDGKTVKEKTQFDFTIICLSMPDRIDACVLLKNSLTKLGIKCTVRPLELTTISSKMQSHQFDACFAGWATGGDPYTNENIWTTKAIDGGRNYMCYSNRYVDGLFELGRQTMENKEAREKIVKDYGLEKIGIGVDTDRAKVYGKIDKILYDDNVATVLYYRSSYYGFSKNWRGYSFSPRGPYQFSPGFDAIWPVTK